MRLMFKKDYAIFDHAAYLNNRGDLMTKDQWYWAMKRDEPFWDELTIKIAVDMRAKGEQVPQWLLGAELDAWKRLRGVAA